MVFSLLLVLEYLSVIDLAAYWPPLFLLAMMIACLLLHRPLQHIQQCG
jgi:hypothetical protein